MSDGIDNLLATAAALSEADRHAFLAALPVETRNELELLLDADRAVQQGNLLQPIADAEPDTAIGEEGSPELPDQIGRYKILQEIGRGGMGLVYMAEQTEPVKRRVALKVIKAGMDSREVIARFEAERQALAMMDHPHIAKVLDAGMTDDRRPYFVMELVRGIPITRYCDENRLTPDERLEIFVKVCRAIQHAHQKGIIHRDIKPTNVLVGLADGEPFPKVIDFGLAKALQSKSLTDKTLFTQFGQVVGTLEYMSPEQAEMDINDVDTRTDVYSLGVLLYELLTGSTPIGRERVREAGIQRVFKLIQEEDAQLPSSRLSDSGDAITGISEQRRTNPKRLGAILKGDLDWIAVKALDKDRKRRYETASELAADITRYLSDEAIEARPPSISYRLQKVWSKHRGKVIVGGLLLGSLVAGLVGTGTMWFRASAAEITANEEADTAKRERKRANDNEQDAKQQAARADHEAEEARDAEAAATLQLAIARWDQGRVAEACHLLEEIPVQYRNTFEWHYWRRRVLGSDLTFFGAHRDVAFNSDGTRLLTAGRYARLWDATSGQLLRTYDDQGIVMSVAFSADGTQVALGGDRQDIRLFSTESGEELGTFKGHTIAPHHIEFSPDGSRVLSSEPDGKSRLWDTRSFTEELVLDSRSSTFSPDGSLIAAGFADSTIRFWDVESRQEIEAKKIQTPAVNRIAFSPDGRQIAGAFHDGILVMHVDSGKEIHRLEGYAFAFSRDGGRITSASRDRTVKVWELTNGQETMSFKGHTETVNRVRFSPDGQRIASAGLDGTCKVWDAVNGQNSRTIGGHSDVAQGIAFSPDGQRIVTASHDKTVRFWDPDTGENTRTLEGHPDHVVNVRFCPDGSQLVSIGDEGNIYQWDAESGKKIRSLRTQLFMGRATAAFGPEGRVIAAPNADKTVTFWDAMTGEKLRTLSGKAPGQEYSAVRDLIFSNDGQLFVGTNERQPVQKWDGTTGKQLLALGGSEFDAFQLAISPDGRQVAAACLHPPIRVWDANTGQEIRALYGDMFNMTCVGFMPDGRRVMAGTNSGLLKIWNLETGKETTTLSGHDLGLAGVAVSPCGTQIATTSFDKTLRIWDANPVHETERLAGHTNDIVDYTISPDGKLIASGSIDTTVRVWDVQTKRTIRVLREHRYYLDRVAFSPDSSRLYSSNGEEQFVWDVRSGELLPNAEWPNELPGPLHESPDGQWLLGYAESDLLIVDRNFKDTPREKAYRESKARPNSWWHRNQFEAALQSRRWFMAAFHSGWELRHNPVSRPAWDVLNVAWDQLDEKTRTLLPDFVEDARALPKPPLTEQEALAIGSEL